MGKLYVGNNNLATNVSKMYVGVNDVARKVEKVYVGVNGIAQLVFPQRLYLWSPENGDNTDITGGWTTGTFYHQTNSGTNYNMTKMTPATWQGINLLQGAYSSSDGSSEKALYTKTTKPIDLRPYKKLVASISRNTTKDNSPTDAWFGVFDSKSSTGLTCKTSELGTKFLASATHSGTVTSGYVGFVLTVDVSAINDSYVIVYDNFHPNMNANITVNFDSIYLE